MDHIGDGVMAATQEDERTTSPQDRYKKDRHCFLLFLSPFSPFPVPPFPINSDKAARVVLTRRQIVAAGNEFQCYLTRAAVGISALFDREVLHRFLPSNKAAETRALFRWTYLAASVHISPGATERWLAAELICA